MSNDKLIACISCGMAFGAIIFGAGTHGAFLILTGQSYFVWPLTGSIIGSIVGGCIGIAAAVYDRE